MELSVTYLIIYGSYKYVFSDVFLFCIIKHVLIFNTLSFLFSPDRLQLPMEALCASLSLFSSQIKKTRH